MNFSYPCRIREKLIYNRGVMGVEMTYLSLYKLCAVESLSGKLIVNASDRDSWWLVLEWTWIASQELGILYPILTKVTWETWRESLQGTAQWCTGTTHSTARTTTQTNPAFPLDHISSLEEQGGCVKNNYTDLSNSSPELTPYPPRRAVTSFVDHGYVCLLSGLVSEFI